MNLTQGVRPGVAVVTAVLVGMAGLLLLLLLRSTGGSVPQLIWLGVVPLVAMIALVLVLSWQVRRYVSGKGSPANRPSPQRARGTLVGAQAAALGGAALVGWYAAHVLLHLPLVDVPSQRGQLLWALVHAVLAAALSVAGFVGQHWCRIPPGEDDDEDGTVKDGGLAYG
ncbi:DUF3180 family protein [Ornithinimicrobium panacihumi]|uniref:DUF3180 family protein n=1 Tax=Ornithinimicrobium panacihumi TaxID=2008449 RepID=UPI003F8AB219